jgi:acyl transferase domain-containing protein/NAD(P)H-dependent flavin oxidoreductase YrpB (nitropropane dioxygenase family)/NADP-dependent 3-hydroxy acid dehydrogenase YdfG
MNPQMPRIVVLAPGGFDGVEVVVAAGRAGALGVLDLSNGARGQFTAVGPSAAAAVARAARFASRPFALRLGGAASNLVQHAVLPGSLRFVIVAGDEWTDWGAAARRVRDAGRVPVAEVTSREAAGAARRAGFEALILDGHEAGGPCGEAAAFVLLQGVLADGATAVWVRGGIGPHAAAACVAAGAVGVVLDGAILLARESPLDRRAQEHVARSDGADSACLGPESGPWVRVHAPPGSPALERLRAAADSGAPAWAEAIRREVGWGRDQAWPMGQDAAFAQELARRHGTVGGIVQAVERQVDQGLELAAALRPLAPGSPLAESHGTRYPIVQGPMTRVSDSPAFAAAVAGGGGLPLLALALARGPAVEALLQETAARLGGRPWGVGLLGFADPRLRAEQVAAIRKALPPFALIAGGRPDQALDLERSGIKTYLHVPSQELLGQFLRAGARRFVLEGRECGGHVGPRSSLVLWEQAVDRVLRDAEGGRLADPEALHLLFAGGIHDGRSAAAVAALAAPLARLGVKVGVLVGTAYLFTEEAVATGAIVPRFQGEAVRCRRTVLLRTGPGHEVRVAPSPFAKAFEAERRRLSDDGLPPEQVREALERLNVGRLRVAAKGLERPGGAGSALATVAEPAQFERGLYMLGQVATLRDRPTTIIALHREISEGGTALLEAAAPARRPEPARPRPSDIAIIGISAIFPGAADLRTFWENTLKGVDAITEVPPDRWDWRPYYDPDPVTPDAITSKWGGFIPEVPFDPLRYGVPPSSVPSIEPAQLLVLEAARLALQDAGYAERAFPRDRTAVVLGMGGGAAQLAMGYAFRSYLPMLEAVAPEAGRAARAAAELLLPAWTEDSFPGFLLNVTAGRVANRLNLGGANYTVDAACGSSLAAAALAVRELETGAADLVLLGGADTVQNPFTYLAFSKTHAFSTRGRCRPFDAAADGIVISEGIGLVVLKRLADAERDGDRIYAVIKGVGASSDGRDLGLTAPNGAGQTRALTRAYAKAGITPASLGYVEAHGTGTAVGDVTEVNALAGFLREAGAAPGSCVVGSVKSLIGHTKCAAGLAGLINASLALYHRVLPPTIGVETLNPKADLRDGPLQVGTKVRPWLHAADHPRRAGVSAFGFGGTNFHAVLEAYEGDPAPRPAPVRDWPAELLVWRAADRASLLATLELMAAQLDAGAAPALRDLAHTLAEPFEVEDAAGAALAIVATSLDDLRARLETARQGIAGGSPHLSDPRGIDFAEGPAFRGAPVAFLFPGQGAQRLEMLGELALAFEEVRAGFEVFDAALGVEGRPPVGPLVFPPTTLDDAGRERARHALTATEAAQPAVGAASLGMLRLLGALGLKPSLVAGHSYGELVALHAAGALDAEALAVLSEARGRLLRDAAGAEPGAMAALGTDAAHAARLIDDAGPVGVVLANDNGPRQAVIAGPRDALAQVVERARGAGVRAFELPVACAFHSPLVAGARQPLALRARESIAASPALPVFSNLDAAPHPADPAAIATRLGDHLASPVRFAAMVEAMYAAGARVFVECGPGAILAPLVDSILGDRPHLAVACDAPGRPGIPTLLRALGRLVVHGVAVGRLVRLTKGRDARVLDLDRLPGRAPEPLPASTWLVNGSRARPLGAPEPRRLGQAPEVLGITARDEGAASKPEAGQRRHHEGNGHAPLAAFPGRNGHVPASRHPASGNGSVPTNGAAARDAHRPPPAKPAHVPNAGPASASTRVIEAFQETMRAFLETQQATMLAYLSGRAPAPSVPFPDPAADRDEPAPRAITEAAPPIAKPPVAGPTDEMEAEPAHSGREAPAEVSEAGGESVSVADRLIAIVRDRTGYPAEMLNLDLDLEADLGIDSIKRVEILGTLRESVAGLGGEAESSLMDELVRARTLGAIVARVEASMARPAPAVTVPPAHSRERPPGPEARARGAVPRRLVLEAVETPLPPGGAALAPGGALIVTDDGRGVAPGLAEALRRAGHPVTLIGRGDLDLSSEAAVADRIASLRRDQSLAGIIHALPLREPGRADLDPAAWAARVGDEVRGLFLLARAAAPDLERAAARGGAVLLAATALGGSFLSDGVSAGPVFAGQGGITGLVKTLAREWPSIRARVIDLDPCDPVPDLVARLEAELWSIDTWAEVGYAGGHRIRLATIERPLRDDGPGLELEPGDPVLVTGGARGITAAVARAIARRWRPTLLLVGSSPPPPESEDADTAGLTEAPALRAALLARLRRSRREVSPAVLERAYKALRAGREIRATLHALRSSGATAAYAQADVRDAGALGGVLDAWRRRFGEPVGLIHGAGVIHDKLLRDKTPELFDRVLGTKIDGALNLARLVRPERLRCAAFFSSIAGRFGNPGQADYAAANDALNKLALWLDQRWPGRVVSVNWGPWAGVGMVSDLEAHLRRRGLGMIDPDAGAEALVDELRLGRKGEVEVILAAGLGTLDGPLRSHDWDLAGAGR